MKGKGDGTKWEEDSEESLCNLMYQKRRRQSLWFNFEIKACTQTENSKFTIDESSRNKKPIDFVTKG